MGVHSFFAEWERSGSTPKIWEHSFNNYVEQILLNFDPAPLKWTSVDILQPPFVHVEKKPSKILDMLCNFSQTKYGLLVSIIKLYPFSLT